MAAKKTPPAAKPAETVTAPIPESAETLAPATEFEASGAIIEPAIVSRVDMSDPSVDAKPRERSTPEMNAIDFNVPSALETQEEAVARNLTSKA